MVFTNELFLRINFFEKPSVDRCDGSLSPRMAQCLTKSLWVCANCRYHISKVYLRLLLNRIDIHIEVPRVNYEKLSGDRVGEMSEFIRARVQVARNIQLARFANIVASADMHVGEIR